MDSPCDIRVLVNQSVDFQDILFGSQLCWRLKQYEYLILFSFIHLELQSFYKSYYMCPKITIRNSSMIISVEHKKEYISKLVFKNNGK